MGGISTPAPPAKAVRRRGRRGTGRVRITDVAKLAGVAPITVSRVLNTPDSVATETLRRVREAIDRIGYVPNMLAGGLASSCSHLIAAVVPTIASPVFQETWEALTDTFANAGYHVTFGQTGYGGTREEELLDAIVARRPDGIVVTGIMGSAWGPPTLARSGHPRGRDLGSDSDAYRHAGGLSHENIGAAVGEYLRAKGRTRIGIITAADPRARRRARGLINAAIRLGFATTLAPEPPMFVAPAPGTLGSGRAGLADLVARHPEIDAVFCSSDMLALGAVIEAQARGISVPEKIAVVGYGNLNFAADTLPPLTTVSVDGSAIGRLAAGCIIDRAQGRLVAEPVVDVGFSIIERASA